MSNYESLSDLKSVLKLFASIATSVQPAWIQHLIDNAFIEQDGKTAIYSLEDIAKEIRKYLNRPVREELLKRFIQKDGKVFAERSIKNAVTKANTPN